jgi:hypothetical protein
MEINQFPQDSNQLNSTQNYILEWYLPYLPSNSCQIKFSLESDYHKHLKIHKDQKPYACNFPGCQFKYSQVNIFLYSDFEPTSS